MIYIEKKTQNFNKKLFVNIINKTFRDSYPSNYLNKSVIYKNNQLIINKKKIEKNKNVFFNWLW